MSKQIFVQLKQENRALRENLLAEQETFKKVI